MLTLLGMVKENLFNIRPIEPHIKGEYFIIKNYLKVSAYSLPSPKFSAGFRLAWKTKPDLTSAFVERFIFDFPDEDPNVLMPLPNQDDSIDTITAWCNLQPKVISLQLGRQEDFWTERLKAMSEFESAELKPITSKAIIVSLDVLLNSAIKKGNPVMAGLF